MPADVISTAQQAAALAHVDLATSVVMEMTALAGTMGRHYAQQEGLPGPVCEAIYESVLPRNAGDAVPATPAGESVALIWALLLLIYYECLLIGISWY